MTTPKEYESLAALAHESATRGPWMIVPPHFYEVRHPSGGPHGGTGEVCVTHHMSDAAFIAAASPDVVLGLINALSGAEASIERKRDLLRVTDEALVKATHERDAALAEVARLREEAADRDADAQRMAAMYERACEAQRVATERAADAERTAQWLRGEADSQMCPLGPKCGALPGTCDCLAALPPDERVRVRNAFKRLREAVEARPDVSAEDAARVVVVRRMLDSYDDAEVIRGEAAATRVQWALHAHADKAVR